MSHNSVKVIDSAGMLVTRTTPKAAQKYVGRGHAHWVGGSAIQIAPETQRCSSEARKLRPILVNGDGFASVAAVKGLPVAGDEIRLFMGKRPTESPRDLPTVEISRRSLPADVGLPCESPCWEGKPLVSAESYWEAIRQNGARA